MVNNTAIKETILFLVSHLTKEQAEEVCTELNCHINLLKAERIIRRDSGVTLNTKLADLDISVRAFNALHVAISKKTGWTYSTEEIGKETLKRIIYVSEKEIFESGTNNPVKTIREINNLLEPLGQALKQ